MQWEHEGCYPDKKKNFVKLVGQFEKTTPPKKAFELCRKKAEGENLEVIAIGTKVINLLIKQQSVFLSFCWYRLFVHFLARFKKLSMTD